MKDNTTALPSQAPIDMAPAIAALPPPDPLTELNNTKATLRETEARLKAAEARVTALIAAQKAWEENPFTLMTRYLGGGLTLIELGEKSKALCEEVLERRMKGTITLSIVAKPRRAGELEFEPVVKVVSPKPEPAGATIFFWQDGKLSRKDHRQREFAYADEEEKFNP